MNRARLVWVPAFLAGAVTATAGELSAGLLLYSGLGFLRALTVVLTVQMGAFAMGLWTAWSPEERPDVDHVRRRWLLCLIAFTGAAVFAGVTRIVGGQSASWVGQGLGLALLGGLPMFAAGGLLGSLGRLAGPGSRRGITVGAGAASGAAVGFLLTGFFFVPRLEPSSTFLICVIALSGGALLHGWVLDQREVAEELESRWTARGLVKVEDRARGVPPSRRRVILEGDRIRGSEYVEGEQRPGWEDAVLATVTRGRPRVESVLLYGTGAGTLARRLRAEWGEPPKPESRAGAPDPTGSQEDSGSLETHEAGSGPDELSQPVGLSHPDEHSGPAEFSRTDELRQPANVPRPETTTSDGSPHSTAGDTADPPIERSILGIEPNPEIRRLALAHFPPGRVQEGNPWAGIQLREGIPLHDVAIVGKRFDLVVVDASALGPANGAPPVSPAVLEPILACVARDGSLVLGGLKAPSTEPHPGLAAWMDEAHTLAAERVALVAGEDMFLVLGSTDGGGDWAGGETREIGRWTTNGSERGPQSDPPAADPGAADPATADPATDPEPDPLSSDRDSAPES